MALPVVGVTHSLSGNSSSWKDEYHKSGGNAYLEWPLDFNELRATVIRLAGSPQS